MKRLFTCLVLFGLSATSQAASVYLLPAVTPDDQNIIKGDTMELALWMDFTGTPTLGGGVDVFYPEEGLKFLNWTQTPIAGEDAGFRRNPDACPGAVGCVAGQPGERQLNGITFGNFNGLGVKAQVGTLQFEALKPGSWSVRLAANDIPAGPFYPTTSTDPMAVQFGNATITVKVGNVPIPSAIWLFGSAAGIFAGFARKKRV